MADRKPRLSICVPSRNRQVYFQKTIEGLLRRAVEGVEFVLADNSDDHSIMNDYMERFRDDPRIVYLPSEDRVLSMMDNWERTLEATTGDWVCVIGDDDYVDPALVDLLDRIVAVNPETEAFSWGVAAYTWPSEETRVHSIYIPYNSFVVKVPRNEPYKRMFGWVGAGTVPTSGYSVYHSAVSRTLLERIKKLYGGKFFEHPVIDYDMAMKIITTGKHFAFCQRPLSIMGACPESNSYSIGRLEDLKKRVKIFMEELGRDMDEDDYLKGFPFKSTLGVTASIVVAQQWFRKKYHAEYQGWEENFVKACAKNVSSFGDRESFDIVKAGYESAIRQWKGGRYLSAFDPEFRVVENLPSVVLTGSQDEGIMLRTDIGGISTPEELYGVIDSITRPLDMIEVPKDGLKYPWQELMHTVGAPPRPIQIEQRRVA